MTENKPDYSEIPFHGGEALLRAIVEEGCSYVFGIPGGEFIEFLEAVDRREHTIGDIHYIGVRHEQAAANMADAFSRVSGKIGVCCATVGPGFADLVPGVAPAFFDNIPMLVVHPQMSDKFDEHHRLQQGLDQLAMLKPVVKYQKSIKDQNRIIWGAQKCFKALFSGKPGPVQLEIVEDAFHNVVEDFGQIILKPHQYRAINPPAGNLNDIKAAVELLLKAEKPLIVSGGGVTSSQGWEILRKLSLEFRIPVCTTVMGIGTMSSNHDTYIGATLTGGGVFKAAAEADVVLALGTKFSFTLGYGKPPLWNAQAKLIQVDIDPQMIGKNKPVELGIVADCKIVLEQLYEEMKKKKASQFSEPWLVGLKKERQSAIEMVKGKLTSDKVPIHPLRLINDLTEFADPEDIICTDSGDTTTFLTTHIDFVKPRAPRTYLNSVSFGHLGVGIPYAIGAKLAKPQSRVFCLSGDGSVLFNIQELYTASYYKIPFVCIVADNCSWGMIKNTEQSTWKKRMPFCVDLAEANYVKIAEGFGCYAERVDEPSQIKPALQRAVDSKRPALIHVPIKSVSPEGSKLLKMFKSLKF
jgi:acetolactate synthase-1/2/3 large subunit